MCQAVVINDEFLTGELLPEDRLAGEPSLDSVFVTNVDYFLKHAASLPESPVYVAIQPLGAADPAKELGGHLSELLHRGKTVVLAYQGQIDASSVQLFRTLSTIKPSKPWNTALRVVSERPSFDKFVRRFGSAYDGYQPGEDSSRIVLAKDETGHDASFVMPSQNGHLAIVQFHTSNLPQALPALLASLLAGLGDAVGNNAETPHFLDDSRLYGENELLHEISLREAELETLNAQADELRQFRNLMGTMQGDALASLAMNALNKILDGTTAHAVAEAETGAEDFWIRHEDTNIGLAEAKGVGTGVKRTHVNQVDNHRDRYGLTADEMPGLLVVNILRGELDLQRRLDAEPSADVLASATKQNVLVVRGTDLYSLLSLRLHGEFDGTKFLEALQSGGGWLKAGDESWEFVQSR